MSFFLENFTNSLGTKTIQGQLNHSKVLHGLKVKGCRQAAWGRHGGRDPRGPAHYGEVRRAPTESQADLQ